MLVILVRTARSKVETPTNGCSRILGDPDVFLELLIFTKLGSYGEFDVRRSLFLDVYGDRFEGSL